MSGLTRSQLENWDPSQLLTLASSWRTMGSSIEGLFDRYVTSVTRVGDGFWEGTTADAAQDRAAADRRTAITVVDALEGLASTAEHGYHAIDPFLRAAKLAIAGAEVERFGVADDLVVSDNVMGPPSDERKQARIDWQSKIRGAAIDVYNADLNAKASLNGLRADLIATFIDAATLTKEQGDSDGQRIVENPAHLTPEQLERLREAGSLTPEQIAALQAGGTTAIPASQMEYINALSRALDGKSPQEIRDLMNEMPPEARTAFANALQIGSNSNITASVRGDTDVPTNGGIAVLPNQIAASLTRDDLVVRGSKTGTGNPGSNPHGIKLILNGVADNQAIAEIAGAAADEYQAGTDLDSKLMDVGAQYLNAQVEAEQSRNTSLEVNGEVMNPSQAVTESIFSNIAADKIVVADAVTDREHGMELVTDILTHAWSDDGKAVSGMFDFGPEPTTYGVETMEAVARASSTNDAWALLSAIPNTDGMSVGEVNPDLLQTLSRNMAPYVTDMAGGGTHADFNIDWADDGSGKFVGAANVFALMNTDEEAGELFVGAALTQQVSLEQEYGHNPGADDSGSKMIGAGRIAGLIDQGTYQAAKDEYGSAAMEEAYERKEAAFEVATSLLDLGLARLPVGSDEASTALALGGDQLKDSMFGPAPSDSPDTNAPEPDGPRANANYWNVLNAAGPLDPLVVGEFGWAVDENGNIRPRSDFQNRGDRDNLDDALATIFARLSDGEDATKYRDSYNDVVVYRRDDK